MSCCEAAIESILPTVLLPAQFDTSTVKIVRYLLAILISTTISKPESPFRARI